MRRRDATPGAGAPPVGKENPKRWFISPTPPSPARGKSWERGQPAGSWARPCSSAAQAVHLHRPDGVAELTTPPSTFHCQRCRCSAASNATRALFFCGAGEAKISVCSVFQAKSFSCGLLLRYLWPAPVLPHK